jgi:thiol-disulfide isomerase/thioredoxin
VSNPIERVLRDQEMASPAAPEEQRTEGWTIAVIGLAIVAGFTLYPRFFPAASALAGKDAPDVSFSMVANAPAEGAKVSLGDLRGHAVLLDFWASWCGPCRHEIPIVQGIARRYGDQGLSVIGVNTSDEAGNAAPFAKQLHLTFPIAYDEGQRVAAAFGVEGLPTLVVISKTGKVLAVRSGETSDSDLDALVKRAL